MSASPFLQVAADFFVAPQLTAEDFAAARAHGIRTVINNRPDGEAEDQLGDEAARAAAAAHGLDYVYVPVVSGGIGPEAMTAFAEAVDQHEGPYLAYCRSGTRSCFLWALQAARSRPPEEIVAAGAKAGYDLSPALPLMRKIREAG